MDLIKPTWPAPAWIKAYTTTRLAWGDPTHASKSAASTDALIKQLSLPKAPIWLNQTHSNIVLEATADLKEPIADASFTSHPEHVCVVLTADCLPLFITNRKGSVVAAIHAGWRGLANNIIEATLDQLKQAPEDVLVWLGPAIGPEKFEVGEDVFNAFTSLHPEAKRAFTPHTPQKWFANLYDLARLRLQLQGVTEVYGGTFCTHTQQDLFYSYRRDHGKTGRMASVIWIDRR